MADDPTAKIRIGGDDAPLRQVLLRMKDGMAGFGQDTKKSIEGASAPLEALRERFLAFSAVLAGGAIFGRAIQQTAQYTDTSIQLAKAMGQGAGNASVWVNALADVGSSTDELGAASRGLLKNVRENEEGLNKMGLATRDAAGHQRPMNDLVLDAIKLTGEFTAGTERQIAAQRIWGKSVDATSNLLKLNSDAVRENEQLMRDLGLIITNEMVQAYEEHDSAMDRAELTFKAMVTTIGGAVMPVLTKLAEWFNNIGPAAVVVIRGAIGGLVSAFWGLKNGVVLAFEVINATVITAAEPIRAVGSALYKLLTGDFKGAQDELMNWPSRIASAWSTAWDNVVASSREAREKMANLFLPGTEAAGGGDGGRRAPPGKTEKGQGAKDGGVASVMATYEAVLAEDKRARALLDGGREYTKQQELAFWQFLLDNAKMGSADRVAITRRTAQLELDITRQASQQRAALEAETTEGAQRLALAKIETEEAAANAALELGQITKAQLAALEVGYEDRRFQIAANGLRGRLDLLALDPDSNPVEKARILNELLLLEEQHKARRTTLATKATTEQNSPGGVMAGLFGSEATWQNLFNGILNNARTWRQQLGGLVAGAGQTMIQELVLKPAAAWAAGLAKMLLVKMGFLSAEKGAEVASSTATVGIKGAETTAVVGMNAAQAGAGAAASQASIPFAGPALALAAMAAVFAAVSGLGKSVKSASGGYDIPRGLNPMVQAHEEEMILPSPLANAVRRMAGEGGPAGAGAAGPAPTLNATPLPGGFWVAQQSEFVRFFKGLERNRAFG